MGLSILYVTAMLFVACTKQENAPSPSRTAASSTTSTTPPPGPAHIDVPVQLAKGEIARCAIGDTLATSGTVEEAKTTIAHDDALYVSMWLNEAPEELQVSAKFIDESGREAAVVRKDDAGGQTVVTLTLDKTLRAGTYKIEGYWGGNLGCEKSITIE